MPKFSALRHHYIVLFSLALLVLLTMTVQGQTTSSYDGKTPSGLAPGAPAGSYPLSGFDNINLYNGKMNFHLPLVQIGGRGSAGYVSLLTIEKQWDVKSQIISQTCLPTTPPIGCSTTKGYWVSDTEWKGVAVGQSAGTLIGRQTGIHNSSTCASMPSLWTQTITRLTFTAPDGIEYELRDKLNNGSALFAGAYACNPGAGPTRGRVWTTVDSSAATFIADVAINDTNGFASGNNNQQTLYLYPSGYMLMRDGTRFRVDNGVVSWVIVMAIKLPRRRIRSIAPTLKPSPRTHPLKRRSTLSKEQVALRVTSHW